MISLLAATALRGSVYCALYQTRNQVMLSFNLIPFWVAIDWARQPDLWNSITKTTINLNLFTLYPYKISFY